MKKFNKDIGKHCEDIAAEYLKRSKYIILKKNFRTHNGELDIICKKDNILVIIEVKGRYSIKYGLPCESVEITKQKNIINCTKVYISYNNLHNFIVRFDVIEVFLDYSHNNIVKINHIQDAFRLN